jgi:hypothetical protein
VRLDEADLIDLGWSRFVDPVLMRRVGPDVNALRDKLGFFESEVARFDRELEARGAVPYENAALDHPVCAVSMTRGVVSFTEDLYFRGDRVKAALDSIVPEFIEAVIGACRSYGTNLFETAEERAGGFLYPLDIFERFWWPRTLEGIDAPALRADRHRPPPGRLWGREHRVLQAAPEGLRRPRSGRPHRHLCRP